MSEVKGMKIYMAADPQEDGAFFIKKSTRDGSLAVFDEEINAARQVKINDDNTELREGFIVRPETKRKIESEIERLTAIATEHATLNDERYELLEKQKSDIEKMLDQLFKHEKVDAWLVCKMNDMLDDVNHQLEKSRIEAGSGDGICN